MRFYFPIILLPIILMSVQPAKASEPEIEVRAFEQSSTDVFDVLTQIMQADAAYAAGEYAAALESYRFVYFHDRGQERATLGYANSALATGQIALADSLFKTLKSDAARTGQVLCAVMQGTTAHPEAALRLRLETAADDSRVWNALGHVLDADGRGAQARQAYAMAGLAGQRAGLTENNLGQSFLMEGDWDTAQTHFTRAVLQAPGQARFDNNRRLTMMLKGNFAEAISGVAPDRASQLLGDAGIIAARKKELILAKTLFETAQSLSPVYDQALNSHIDRLNTQIQAQL
ncbi:hypothetical protein ACJ3XI_11920 [Litorimonas sp. RW-G-Af-16]|uniref:hypothetical protein n=1 Tax=Litorimonas sp. RW-G-Af-16 TaxID=3241168 RepID=UPI00390C4C65